MLRRGILALAIGLLAFVAPANKALAGYSLFGDAQIVSPGNASTYAVQIRSTCPGGAASCLPMGTYTFGGVDFDIPAGLTFGSFMTLAADIKFTDGSCGGGGPRFVIDLQSGIITGDISVYIGPPPGYVGCPMNVYAGTGDLLEGINPLDTTHLPGGAFYDPYPAAVAKYGSYTVTGVQLVTDGAWSQLGNLQTVHADNVDINGTIYTFDQPQTKGDCKKSGWEVVTRADGSEFKNQGACVSYFNTGK
jgi:hypothetical protein